MSSTKTPSLQIIRGVQLPAFFNKTVIEEVMDFMPEDGDIIIATYPKTGTTWMSYIVHQLFTKGESFPSFKEMLKKDIPFLEMTGVEAVENLKVKPRIYKHHLPYNKVKKNPNAKIIYVYRKPEDTFVSYYHFMKDVCKPNPIDFDEYFETFLSGDIAFGRYFEHILSYLECERDGNILFVCYEKLKTETKKEILRVAQFLNDELYELFANDEPLMNKVIEQTSFKFMKSNLVYRVAEDREKEYNKNVSTDHLPQDEVTFFRKGKIGEGEKCLSEDQLSRLRKLIKQIMKGTDILKEWLPEA